VIDWGFAETEGHVSERSEHESRFTELYGKVGVILLNTVVLLIVLNLVLGVGFAIRDAKLRRHVGDRSALPFDFRSELLDAAYPDLNPEVRDAMLREVWTRGIECASFTHYREPPFDGRYVHVDGAGFRWNATRPPWPLDTGALNVFVIGASTTFGFGVMDGETIPAFLQEDLRRRLGDDRVHVYNFGRRMYYSSQEQILFINLLRERSRPDAVVFIDGYGEFFHLRDESRHLDACGLPRRWGFVLPMVRLGRYLGRRLSGDDGEGEKLRPTPENLRRVTERYARVRRITRAVAREFDVETLFVWQPNSYYRYDPRHHIFSPDVMGIQAYDATLRLGYEVMSQQAHLWRDWDDFLYLADIQVDRTEPLYVDRAHYSTDFNAEIAAKIAHALLPRLRRADPP
jgi:hypothetical protein